MTRMHKILVYRFSLYNWTFGLRWYKGYNVWYRASEVGEEMLSYANRHALGIELGPLSASLFLWTPKKTYTDEDW